MVQETAYGKLSYSPSSLVAIIEQYYLNVEFMTFLTSRNFQIQNKKIIKYLQFK